MAEEQTKTGKVVAVAGSVVDVTFDEQSMPHLQTALHIKRDDKTHSVLTLEVVQLLESKRIG